MRLGVAARPTHRPISNGHSPSFSTSFCRSSSNAQIRAAARPSWSRVKQPQRVSHQDAEAGRCQARISQPPQHERERSQAEIRFGLTTTGREEQQIDQFAIVAGRIGDPLQVHQDERELKRSPGRRDFFRRLVPLQGQSPTSLSGHGLVGDTKRFQALRIIEQVDARLNPVRGELGAMQQFVGRFLASMRWRRGS